MRGKFLALLFYVIILAIIQSPVCYAQLANSPWPCFRHDQLHTGQSTLRGPSSHLVTWTYTLPGQGISSPAVDAERVYTCAGGKLVALACNGDEIWSFSCGNAGMSSPAVGSDGTVYIASTDGYLYAVTSDGQPKWKKSLQGSTDCSPTIGPDGCIYIGGSAKKFFCFRKDGTQKFSYTMGGAVSSSAAIASDGTVYVGCDDGKLYAFTSTGTLKWTFSTSPLSAIKSSPCVAADGTIYIASMGGYVYSLRTDGRQVWRTSTGGSIVSSPAIGPDGSIVIGSRNGYLYCISSLGVVKWKYQTGGYVDSSPAVDAAGVAYVGSNDGSVYAVNSDGTLLWSSQIGTAVSSSPAIGDGGSLYVATYDGSLYAFSTDATPPTTPDVIDDGAYSISQSTLHASWSASDPDSGVVRYEYAIGTAPGGQEILPFTDTGTATEMTRSDLQIPNGATCYISVRATNGAGLASEVGTSDGIIVDYTAPSAPIVTDDGVYSMSSNTLHATWSSTDAESGLARYEYAIGTSAGAQDLVPFTSVGLAVEITRSDLALVNGKDYFFSVRSVNRAGLVSAVGVSNGIRVDTTPPTPPVVFDDGEYTGVSNKLHFVFGSGDTESGIARYEYSISTAIGGADVIPWTDSALVREFTLTSLNLSHNVTYYVNVRAYNYAGLMSEGHSNGIKPDLTSPTIDSISAGGSQSEIKATIKASDPESGVGQVQYVLLTSPTVPANPVWISAQPGQDIAITGPFDFKLTYYVAARAANTVGAWSAVAISNPIRLDETAPTTPVVTDDGAYSTDATTLHASWAASDLESGIDHYSYCVGSAPAAADISAWKDTSLTSATLTGLSLSNGGVYYFTVKAINRAGLTSPAGSSNGITIDTTPPAQPVVTDDGDVTYVTDSLHATWTCLEPQSGVAEYFYCVGTAPGKNDIVGWISSGTDALAVVTGLSLKIGVRYYISVKARNNAGLVSTVGSSDGIEYRLGTAVWQKFRCNSSNTGFATASGSATGTLRWKVSTEGYVESSAAIGRDGTSYVGSSDGKLYAISTAGYVRWTYQTGGCIDSSPAIDSFGNIYVGSYDGSLYCIQPSGTLLWKYSAGGMIWSSPTVTSDGTIIFGCMDGYVYALTSSGALKWQYKTGGSVWSSPCLGPDGSISFGCGDGGIYSLTSVGKLKWIYQTGSAADASPAVDKNGVVYVGSGDGAFYAINPDGSRKWQINTGEVCDSSPVIDANGRVYFGSGVIGWDGAFYCASPEGNVLWKIKTPGAIKSSAAMGADGTMYVGSGDGTLYAINTDGLVLWTRKVEQSILSSPAIGADGSVVFGSDDGCVYCFRDTASIDLTPPTTPSVSLVQDVITPDMPLGCSWSASDPESGIQCYYYALGTGPGLDDIIPWTNAGIATTMSLTKLALSPGSCYYVSVKAKNGMSLTSAVGVSKPLSVVLGDIINTVGAAKQRPDGAPIYIQGKVVTAVFDDCIFIEDPNRAAGIRCMVSGCNLAPGAIVNVSGVVGTLYSDKVLNSAVVQDTGLRGNVAPLYVTCNFGSRTGLNPSGLLIRTVGRVTQSGAGFFVISDGSVVASPRGVAGVEIRAQNLVAPASGTVISATGVASMDIVDGKPVPVIRATLPPEFVEISETR